ncbi:hypothetical protein [Novosphingobium sp.]|uniref:hypothetical protein n=1 Tax=Novosphingobium sp. TaxID=1874826 RepID=UPI0025CE0CBB|nr:hypothetical protein [Novosphingobium sp.]
MSKQLALSIALSVLAMTAFVLLGPQRSASMAEDGGLSLPIKAHAPALPSLSHLIPSLQ